MYAMNAPLILTQKGKESVAAAYAAENNVTKAYVLGGTSALSEKTVSEVFGLN